METSYSIQSFRPSIVHRIYVLIGLAWPVFGIIFIYFLCDASWLSGDFRLSPYFPLATIAALGTGYLLARFLSSKLLARLFAFIKHGQPFLYFDRAVDIAASMDPDKPALMKSGLLQLDMTRISRLHLTLLGVMEMRSDDITGGGTSYVLARMPLSVLSLADQKDLVEAFKKYRPDLIVSDRLAKRLMSSVVKGQGMVQALGALVLVAALIDVSYASFVWLDILKEHYAAQTLARTDAIYGGTVQEKLERARSRRNLRTSWTGGADDRDSLKKEASKRYRHAEQMRATPFPLSCAFKALFTCSNSASQLDIIRAETLRDLGRPEEACEILQGVVAKKQPGVKAHLALVRLLIDMGQIKAAQSELLTIEDAHKDLLLPKVLRLDLERRLGADAKERASLLARSMQELDEQVFGDEPAWPPGGERPITEMWHRQDLEILGRDY